MSMIEFSDEVYKAYNLISNPLKYEKRGELLCRIYNQKTPKRGYLASGLCFANILKILAKDEGLTHIEYNPLEFLEVPPTYSSVSREGRLLKRQKMRRLPMNKKDREKWLHLGKTYKLLPKGRSTDVLLKKGVKIAVDSSPIEILHALIHMRHLYREKRFIKSVLFLISKTNMDFWQAYALASYDRIAVTGEHTIYKNIWWPTDGGQMNIMLLPALHMVHESPKEFDKREVRSCKEWDTDEVIVQASKYKLMVDRVTLRKIDFKPLIHSNILREKGVTKDKVVNFVREILGREYIVRRG